jgi:replicative DNA helicase
VTPMNKRILPHHPEAEASILGGIILRNRVLDEIVELEAEAFYDNRHKVVFQAIRNLEAAARPIDVVTLENEIQRSGKLEAIGGVGFLGELTLRVPTADNVVAYAEIVSGKHQVRRLMLAASEIAERGYDDDLDTREYLTGAESAILQLSARDRRAADVPTIGQAAKARWLELDGIAAARARGETAMTGVSTGVLALDRQIGGWPRGIVSLIGGRPGMGKSAVALASVDAATAAGVGAWVFSLEDSRRAYADRVLARGSGVSAERIRQADIGAQDASLLAHAVANLLKRDNWRLDDRRGLTAREIARTLRRAKATIPGFGLGVVDYLHLVGRERRLVDNEPAALEQIMGVLSDVAGELDIALLVLAQLNRSCEDRVDKRPVLSDIRSAGEEKAKLVVFPYRGAKYASEPRLDIDYECNCLSGTPDSACPHKPDADEWERLMQFIIAKNNNGQTGRVFGSWYGPTLEVR